MKPFPTVWIKHSKDWIRRVVIVRRLTTPKGVFLFIRPCNAEGRPFSSGRMSRITESGFYKQYKEDADIH